MSDKAIIDTIAAELDGMRDYDDNGNDVALYAPEAAAQLLAAMRWAGYAVVKLPEPEDGEWPVDYPRQNATGWVHVDSFGAIRFPPHSVLPSQARQLAAALLAAADKAEEADQ